MTRRTFMASVMPSALAAFAASAGLGLSGCRGAGRGSAPPCASEGLPLLRIAMVNPSAPAVPNRVLYPPDRFTDVRLITLASDGRGLPSLAKAWHTDDRQTWTFTLRPGLRTQDGRELTAALLGDQFLKMAPTWAKGDDEWSELAGVDAPAPDTLVVRLTQPDSGFVETLMSTGITGRESPLLAGPYRLTHDTDDEMHFETFPGYWGGPPAVAGVRVRFYASARRAWAAFMRNEADLLYTVPTEAVSLLRRDPDVQLLEGSQHYVIALGFQQRHPVLRDVRVRQALNLAIDRDEIMRRFFPMTSLKEHGPFSPEYWAIQGAGSPWKFDPVEARALLAPATADGRRPLDLVCLTSNEFEPATGIAAAIEQHLLRVHIRIKMVALSRMEFTRRVAKGDFDLFAMPLSTGFGPRWAPKFWRSGPSNRLLDAGYTAADDALDALRRARSPEAEQTAARAVLDVMRRDPPAVFIGPQAMLRAAHRRWQVPSESNSLTDSLAKWKLAPSAGCAAE